MKETNTFKVCRVLAGGSLRWKELRKKTGLGDSALKKALKPTVAKRIVLRRMEYRPEDKRKRPVYALNPKIPIAKAFPEFGDFLKAQCIIWPLMVKRRLDKECMIYLINLLEKTKFLSKEYVGFASRKKTTEIDSQSLRKLIEFLNMHGLGFDIGQIDFIVKSVGKGLRGDVMQSMRKGAEETMQLSQPDWTYGDFLKHNASKLERMRRQMKAVLAEMFRDSK